MVHRILARHLKNLGLSDKAPPDLSKWQEFIGRIDTILNDYEQGRYLLERSLEISSTEMLERAEMIELERAKSMHAAKMATLGEMAGGIAHEINNPLAVIAMRAQNIRRLLQREVVDKTMAQKFIDDITETTERIAKIVRGLRAFSRLDDSDPFRLTKISDLVDDTLALCGEKLSGHGIKIDVAPMSKDLAFECHPVQIVQVLLNLVMNSYDAVHNHHERWIKIAATQSDNMIEIRISDSGLAIPLDIRDRIFQPFFTTKPVGEGTGLGLSISHGIIKGHKGGIKLIDVEGHNCFVISVPCLASGIR